MTMDNDEIIKEQFKDLIGAIADDWEGVRSFMRMETGDYQRINNALNEARRSERAECVAEFSKLISEHKNCHQYHAIKNERGFGEDATCLDLILSQLKEMK